MTYSAKELAQKCGVSDRAIRDYTQKEGLGSKSGRSWKYSEEEAEAIIRHYSNFSGSTEEDVEETCISEEAEVEDWKLPEDTVSSVQAAKIETLETRITDFQERVQEQQEIIALLRQQLEAKDGQIAALQDTTKALSASTAMTTAADKKELILSDGSKKAHSRLDYLKAVFTGKVGK